MKKDMEMNGERYANHLYKPYYYAHLSNKRRLPYQGEAPSRDLKIQAETDMKSTIKSIIDNKLQSFDTEQLLVKLTRMEEENFNLKRRTKFLEERIKYLEDEKRGRYAGMPSQVPIAEGTSSCITRATADIVFTNARYAPSSENPRISRPHSSYTYAQDLNRVRPSMAMGVPYPSHDPRDLNNGANNSSQANIVPNPHMHREIDVNMAENLFDPLSSQIPHNQAVSKQNSKVFGDEMDTTHVSTNNETALCKEQQLNGIPYFSDYTVKAEGGESSGETGNIRNSPTKEDSSKHDSIRNDSTLTGEIRASKNKKKSENTTSSNSCNMMQHSPRGGMAETIKYPKVALKSSGVKPTTPDIDQAHRYHSNTNNFSARSPSSLMYRGINPGADPVEYKPLSKPSSTPPPLLPDSNINPTLPYAPIHSNSMHTQQPHVSSNYSAPFPLQILLPHLMAHITSDKSSIILTWDIVNNTHIYHKNVDAYFLYAFHTLDLNHAPPSDISFWKRISVIKPLPLPIACTLTQSFDGHNYFFAVAAVDRIGRVGPLSNPCALKVAL